MLGHGSNYIDQWAASKIKTFIVGLWMKSFGNHALNCEDTVHDLMLSRFFAASQFDDPKFFEIGSTDYALTFGSLNLINLADLSVGRQRNVTERIIRVLVHGHVTRSEEVLEHLSM